MLPNPPTRDRAPLPPAPGALRPPVRSRKLWQLVTKSLPGRRRRRGCGTQESGGAAGGGREPGHESRFVAVSAGFGSVGAGGEASACLLAARGTRGAGAPALPAAPPRKEA